ncbi:hypothetical protein CsSME_00054298 [Camellia sinensis var. sinensis]
MLILAMSLMMAHPPQESVMQSIHLSTGIDFAVCSADVRDFVAVKAAGACGARELAGKFIGVTVIFLRLCHCSRKRKSRVRRTIRVPAISPKVADIPADEDSWRKYGPKPIKRSPYPRGYYKCSSGRGCPVTRTELDLEVLRWVGFVEVGGLRLTGRCKEILRPLIILVVIASMVLKFSVTAVIIDDPIVVAEKASTSMISGSPAAVVVEERGFRQ